jgi:hypothetical protein
VSQMHCVDPEIDGYFGIVERSHPRQPSSAFDTAVMTLKVVITLPLMQVMLDWKRYRWIRETG